MPRGGGLLARRLADRDAARRRERAPGRRRRLGGDTPVTLPPRTPPAAAGTWEGGDRTGPPPRRRGPAAASPGGPALGLGSTAANAPGGGLAAAGGRVRPRRRHGRGVRPEQTAGRGRRAGGGDAPRFSQLADRGGGALDRHAKAWRFCFTARSVSARQRWWRKRRRFRGQTRGSGGRCALCLAQRVGWATRTPGVPVGLSAKPLKLSGPLG